MADVNINQTYRINIETNKEASKTVQMLKNFKGTLTDLEKLGDLSGLDKTVDNIISCFNKLKTVSKGFDKDVVKGFNNIVKSLNKLKAIDVENINANGITSLLESLKTIDFGPLKFLGEQVKDLDTEKILNTATALKELAQAQKIVKQTEMMGMKSRKNLEDTNIEANRFVKTLQKIKDAKFGQVLDKIFSGIGSKIGKITAFLGRFIKYRIANMFFRAFTADIQTGIANIYEWSRTMDGTANRVAQTLDRLKTNSNYLKNSFASLATNVLGVLMPAFESLINILVNVINAFNQMIAYITGSPTWNKAIKVQSQYQASIDKTAKALGKLAGFDELNNIGGSSGSASSVDPTNPYQFEEVDVDTTQASKNLRNLIDLVSLLGTAILGIKALKFAEMLGLTSLQALGLGIAIGGLITTIANLIIYINDPSFANFGSLLTSLGVTILGFAMLMGNIPLAVVGGLLVLIGLFTRFKDEVDSFVGWLKEKLGSTSGGGILGWIHTNLTESDNVFLSLIGYGLENIVLTISDRIDWIMDIFSGLSQGMKLILDGIILFVKGDFKAGFKSAWEGVKLIFKTIWDGIWANLRITLNSILRGIESMVNWAIRGINKLLAPLRDMSNGLAEFIGVDWEWKEFSTISLPRLATGTNYVPQDTLAMLHQGEAVVPKKFNSEEFFGGDSEETNELLRELISVVRKKNFSITKKEVGEASVDYIRSQTRLKGASVI